MPFELVPGLRDAVHEAFGPNPAERYCTDGFLTGLVSMEIPRVDPSLGHVLRRPLGPVPVLDLAVRSDAQKERWIGPLERFEAIGSWALTEPEHGSDAALGLENLRHPRRRHVDDPRGQKVVWQRELRRRHGHLGARHGRWERQGVPRREGDARLPRRDAEGEDRQAVGPERRHPTRRRRGGGVEPAPRRPHVQGRGGAARDGPRRRLVGGVRDGDGALRDDARLLHAARPVREAHRRLPARPGRARADARQRGRHPGHGPRARPALRRARPAPRAGVAGEGVGRGPDARDGAASDAVCSAATASCSSTTWPASSPTPRPCTATRARAR